MPQTGQFPRIEVDTAIALSLMRLGGDTKAMRLFREMVPSALVAPSSRPGSPVDGLADALGLTGPDRFRRLSDVWRRAQLASGDRKRLGLTLLSVADEAYPGQLREIPNPPIVLWVEGMAEALTRPAVAVVGSRHATGNGLAVARRLGAELAEAGLVVVSGLARGIDGAAHAGALVAGGVTVAVLGSGSDVIYPDEHRDLARRIAKAGAVVTEFPPGARPHASHFPLRNRIISGLSRAIVVVEASEKSGSLITARAALEQGRDVLAVPGSVTSGCYRGCHALIKDGARLVETVEDVLDEIGWRAPRVVTDTSCDNSLTRSKLEHELSATEPVGLDLLAGRTQRTVADLLAELGTLEVDGKVARTAGGEFVRLDAAGTNRDR